MHQSEFGHQYFFFLQASLTDYVHIITLQRGIKHTQKTSALRFHLPTTVLCMKFVETLDMSY